MVRPSSPVNAPRQRLDRHRVLAAALELVDAEGLEALSMRRLAARLGVEPMAIYRYAPGKQALVAGVVDMVMEKLQPPSAAGAGWAGALAAAAGDFRRVVLEHPKVFPLILGGALSLPMAQRAPSALAWFEGILSVLEDAGFGPEQAVLAYQSFSGFLLGSLVVELRQVVEDPDEPELGLSLGLHRLPARRYPRLRWAMPLLATLDREEVFARSLEVVLDGLGGMRTDLEEAGPA